MDIRLIIGDIGNKNNLNIKVEREVEDSSQESCDEVEDCFETNYSIDIKENKVDC